MSPAQLLVLSGPSGVGKSTLVRELRERRPDIWVSVSATTRQPRSGEVDGHDYFFLTLAEFERQRVAGNFLEAAEFAGNWYGTPRQPVLQRLSAGQPVVLEIDLAGARQVRAALPEARLVFIAPPSWQDLVSRLSGRGTEDPAIVERRLEVAKGELQAESEFDDTVVNDHIESALARLISLLGSTVEPAAD